MVEEMTGDQRTLYTEETVDYRQEEQTEPGERLPDGRCWGYDIRCSYRGILGVYW